MTRSPTIHIRPAEAEDYERLCVLFQEVDRLHRQQLPDRFRCPEGPPRSREYVSSLISDSNVGLFVADAVEQCVGYVHATLTHTPDVPVYIPCRYAVIEDLVVDPTCRRKGIGRALVEYAHAWARSEGAPRIELNVYEFNADAIRFYETLGYTTLSRKMALKTGD